MATNKELEKKIAELEMENETLLVEALAAEEARKAVVVVDVADVTEDDVMKAKYEKQLLVTAAEEKEARENPRRAAFNSTLFTVNPYTNQTFDRNLTTEDVLIDSWVLSQKRAGILTEVK